MNTATVTCFNYFSLGYIMLFKYGKFPYIFLSGKIVLITYIVGHDYI